MAHPNPRFLAVARRAQPQPAPAPVSRASREEKKKKGIGTGWKFLAIAAGAGVLLWTLSTPTRDDEPDEGERPQGPQGAKTLPPGQARHGGQGEASVAAEPPANAATTGGEGTG